MVKGTFDGKYDIVKFALSFFVVAIHSCLLPKILYPWLRIAVPLFFMISAYFLFLKLQSIPRADHRRILIQYILRNGKLYLFWFVVLIPVTLYIRYDLWFSTSVWNGILVFFQNLLFGSTFGASWYLTASIIGVIIVYLLSHKGSVGWLCAVSVIAFSAVTFFSTYMSLLPQESAVYVFYRGYERFFGNPVLSFPAALVWITAGKAFAEGWIPLRKLWENRIVLVISCVALYLEWQFATDLTGSRNNDSYFMLLPVCISVFGCLQKLPPVNCRFLLHLRRASTVIYVSHVSAITILGFLFRHFWHIDLPLLLFVSSIACGVVLYGCIAYITSRYPQSKLAKLLSLAC